MTGWSQITGLAVALPMDNIDTDQLIPARFMSAPRADGYGKFLLHDLRGPQFPLDQYPGASILVAGRNFGSGSSREAAVYALVDAGITCVVAPGFGDIFAGNAVNNGLCPARLADTGPLLAVLGDAAQAQIDLTGCTIAVNDHTFDFQLDPVWQRKLINGWDDIDLSMSDSTAITRYRNQRKTTVPWAWPHAQQKEHSGAKAPFNRETTE